MHLKHFFFLRKGLVYLLYSVFLNNLWIREAPLIDPFLPHSLWGRLGQPSPATEHVPK